MANREVSLRIRGSTPKERLTSQLGIRALLPIPSIDIITQPILHIKAPDEGIKFSHIGEDIGFPVFFCQTFRIGIYADLYLDVWRSVWLQVSKIVHNSTFQGASRVVAAVLAVFDEVIVELQSQNMELGVSLLI